MGEFDVLIHCLLDKLYVLLLLRLGDDVPYELLDAGVNMLLVVARHGRIFAEIVAIENRSISENGTGTRMRRVLATQL